MQMNTWHWDWCYRQNLAGGRVWSLITEPAGNKWSPCVSNGEKEHSSGVRRAYWESFKLYLKETGDIARLDRAWHGDDCRDQPRSERRLKREYIDQAQAARDITTRQEHPCAPLLGYWHNQIVLWSACTPAHGIWGTGWTRDLWAVTGLWPYYSDSKQMNREEHVCLSASPFSILKLSQNPCTSASRRVGSSYGSEFSMKWQNLHIPAQRESNVCLWGATVSFHHLSQAVAHTFSAFPVKF